MESDDTEETGEPGSMGVSIVYCDGEGCGMRRVPAGWPVDARSRRVHSRPRVAARLRARRRSARHYGLADAAHDAPLCGLLTSYIHIPAFLSLARLAVLYILGSLLWLLGGISRSLAYHII